MFENGPVQGTFGIINTFLHSIAIFLFSWEHEELLIYNLGNVTCNIKVYVLPRIMILLISWNNVT